MNIVSRIVSVVLVSLLVAQPCFAWKLKIFGIKACHDCNRGLNIDADKIAKNIVKSAADIAKDNLDALESLAKAQLSGLKTTVNFAEAGVALVKGNPDSAKRALRRAKDNIHKAADHADAGIDKAVNTALKGAREPYFITARGLDDTFRTSGNYSLFVQKTSGKIGAALKGASQPKILAKVAFVAAASTLCGPMGAAFANVLYDKVVLKKDMTDREMFTSFMIGAAAGYAAESVSAGVTLNSNIASRQLANSLTGVARNLTTDAGNIVLNDQSYNLKDFISSLARGAAEVDVDVQDGFASKMMESTFNSGSDSAIAQAIESDLKKIDFEKVTDSMIKGFADGATSASVQNLVNVSLDKALPADFQRLDKVAMDKIAYLFDRFTTASYENDVLYAEKRIANWYQSLSEKDQEQYAANISAAKIRILQELANQVYGKQFAQLTEAELDNEKFMNEFDRVFGEYASKEAKNFKSVGVAIAPDQVHLGRSPASVFGAFKSMFGFGTSVSTAAKIGDMRTDLLNELDYGLLLRGDKRQWKIERSINRLQRLGLVYLKDVTAAEGVDLLQSYYKLQIAAPKMAVEGILPKNQEALIKMAGRNAKKFYEKYDEMKTVDDLFLAIAQDIVDETQE